MSHTLFILTAWSFLLVTTLDSNARADADDTFVLVTTVYDCVARERPFSIVTRTAPNGLTIFIPEPFVSRTLLLERVEAASGERYEKEGVTAWLKGDDAIFTIDTVSVTACDPNPEESLWEAAKLDGVDFRAIGHEPGWVLEIRERSRLTVHYYNNGDNTVVDVTAADIATDQDRRASIFYARSETGDIRVTLSGKTCIDNSSGKAFGTSVLIELDKVRLQGCGKALY